METATRAPFRGPGVLPALRGRGPGRRLLPVVPAGLFIAAWWVAGHTLGGLRGQIFASPVAITEAFVRLLLSSDLWSRLLETVQGFVLAFTLSYAIGLVGGILIGTFRRPTRIVEPFAFGLYTIPKITLFPVLLAIFGLTPTMVVMFAALHGVLPVFLATVNALKRLNPTYPEVALCFGASRSQVYRKVVFRAILLPVIAAARICLTLCILSLITAEIISGAQGIGHLVMTYYHGFDYPSMYAAICFTVIVCGLAYLSANQIERRLSAAVQQG